MLYFEVFLQTLLAFGALMVYARLLGKQQIGQLTFFEYVNGITFGSIAAVLATDIGPHRTWVHFLGLTIFAALTWAMGYVSMKTRPARKLISGEGTVVVENGKILENNMRKMRYNVDELTMQLREKDVFDIDKVEYAVVEPNGNLSVLLKSQHQAVTPADLQLPTSYEGMAVELVVDGKLIAQNLGQLGLTKEWLLQELQSQNVTRLAEVTYAVLGSSGRLYLDKKRDDLNRPTDITDQP